jgi:ribosomal protein S18 acetylase RimI-like enzyme
MLKSPNEIHDIKMLADFFRGDPFLHLYALGDLDDFFRPHVRWWGLTGPEGELREVALLYDPGSLPVLLAFTRNPEAMRSLLAGIRDELPDRFYAHLSPGVEAVFAGGFHLESHGMHLRMGLIDESRLMAAEGRRVSADDVGSCPGGAVAGLDAAAVSGLSRADLAEVLEFFEASYPGNWFDPRMIDTGRYVGARIDGRLCAVAGVHVYSETYRVAALGNIATAPGHRGRGLAGLVTGALCRALRDSVDWIGLNVHAENAAAIACYRRLGFARVVDYNEIMVE